MKRPGNVLGDILRRQRLAMRMTQKQAAALIGADQNLISKWELGYARPNLRYLRKISKIYSMQLSFLTHMRGDNENGGAGEA